MDRNINELTDDEKALALNNKIAAVTKVKARLGGLRLALEAVNLFLEQHENEKTAQGIAASLLWAIDEVVPLDSEEKKKVQKVLKEKLVDWL